MGTNTTLVHIADPERGQCWLGLTYCYTCYGYQFSWICCVLSVCF